MSSGNGTTGDTRVGTDPLAATAGYRAWGWPATLRRNQISLDLDGDTVALIIPVLLATEVTTILVQRFCPVPVLAHPYAPEHRILLVAERFRVALPWPPCVHQITGTLLLPPTATPRGPITWTQLPEPDALRLSREIDVLAALRAALNDPPAPHLVVGSGSPPGIDQAALEVVSPTQTRRDRFGDHAGPSHGCLYRSEDTSEPSHGCLCRSAAVTFPDQGQTTMCPTTATTTSQIRTSQPERTHRARVNPRRTYGADHLW